mgnify:FL=1
MHNKAFGGKNKVRIGIIGPTEREIMPFVNKIDSRETIRHAKIDFYSGKFENVDVVAAFSGVCKVNAAIATQIMIDRFDVTHIILTGVAGALDESLQIGDTVIANEIAYHDVAREILTEYHPWMEDIYFKSDMKMLNDASLIAGSLNLKNKCFIGRIITGEAFITENERYKLIQDFEPLCADMESAGVAHVCYANNVPFLVIRSISDFANEDGPESFENNIGNVSFNSLHIVEELIKEYA